MFKGRFATDGGSPLKRESIVIVKYFREELLRKKSSFWGIPRVVQDFVELWTTLVSARIAKKRSRDDQDYSNVMTNKTPIIHQELFFCQVHSRTMNLQNSKHVGQADVCRSVFIRTKKTVAKVNKLFRASTVLTGPH